MAKQVQAVEENQSLIAQAQALVANIFGVEEDNFYFGLRRRSLYGKCN